MSVNGNGHNVAIAVEDVSKRFRIYHERNQYLKASVLRGRRARFEEFWAVRNVSFDIAEGETFGIIGENGSGKSTLLKCLAGILVPEEGSVRVNGKLSAMLELGAGFHPELSGRENIFLNGSILGLSRKQIAAKFDEIVDFAGLERFIDTPVKNYSSGMYVRLGFAVAVNVEPDILLVDEVLAVGDESFQRKCSEKFAEFRATGRTIVIVTHGLSIVRNICDRAAWLQQGSLRALGDPGEVVDEYTGAAHADRESFETEGTRWGSGEVRLTKVEMLDREGNAVTRVHTGDDVTFRFHYHAHVPVHQPVFGMGIYHVSGPLVTGPNTRDAGVVPERISGVGHVDVRFRSFDLLPGSYALSCSINDLSLLHVFDARHLAFRFDVLRGEPYEAFGFVTLNPQWYVDAFDRPQMQENH